MLKVGSAHCFWMKMWVSLKRTFKVMSPGMVPPATAMVRGAAASHASSSTLPSTSGASSVYTALMVSSGTGLYIQAPPPLVRLMVGSSHSA
jgi:hypothetical protein